MSLQPVVWNYEQMCKRAVDALDKNGFHAFYMPGRQDAFEYIIKAAKDAETIGFGGSMSVSELKVAEKLAQEGKKLLVHARKDLSVEEKLSIMRQQLTCDLFLTGTNAITLSGHLVNIDAHGNRAAAMFFGPRKIIVVAGRNKIAENNQEAIKRIKTHAAPPNCMRLNLDTPCAKTGFCHDCHSPSRACRITTVIERQPRLSDIHVLVVNEEMGF